MKFKKVKWSAESSAALKSALSFLIIGILWITFSNRIAVNLSKSPNELEQIEMIKGWSFILITSILLFFLIKRYTSRANATLSERKAVEKHLDIFTKYVNDIILFMDYDGQIIEANDRAIESYGYTKSEMLKLNIEDLLVLDENNRLLNRRKKMTEGEGSVFESTHKNKDGKAFPVEVSSRTIDIDGKIYFQSIIRNITERKKAEEQIRKLSSAVEQSPSSIIITEVDGRIEYVNPKFTSLTGYSLSEVKGKKPSILSSGETPLSEYKKLWSLILSGKEWKGEFRNKKKNGELYWESALISPIKDQAGNITHFLALKEDITQQKLLSQELVAAKEKAEESDRLKSEFLAQMSHEIRTPLNIILSYSSLVKEETEELYGERFKPMFSSIDSAGKRLLRTINSVLNMSSLHSGNLKVNFSEVDIESIIKNLLIERSYTAEQKRIKLTYTSELENTTIVTDEYIVSEILQNLIDNAIKYTDKGEVEIKLYTDNFKKLSIDVRDTGIGISQNYLPKLFNPFTQEDGGYSRKYEGNGLGLALVKNFADLIGASVKAQSQKGLGSTFTLLFNR